MRPPSAHNVYPWEIPPTALPLPAAEPSPDREEAERLALRFQWHFECGWPPRGKRPPVFLEPGERAIVRFNGRLTGDEGIWYEEKVIHVANGVMPRRSLFEETTDAKLLEARADVW